MAYYLTVEKKKGEYTPLDIIKDKHFARYSNLKGMGSTLQEIDIYTMMFNDEAELRKSLLDSNLLTDIDCYRPLSIRNLRKGKFNKVMHGFLYQKDIEYVMDPKKIIKKINDKLLSGDFRFIEKFANNYMTYRECSSTAPEVREYARESARTGIPSRHFYELDENNDNPLTRMAKLLIYEYYQAPSGRVEYKNKVTYRNLHSIIAFVNNYEMKYQEEQTPENSLFKEEPKKRIKSRKKEVIDGQFSFFE